MNQTSGKKKFGKKGAAATGAAAVALLALLFGTGKLGFGTDTGLGDPTGATGKENQAVVSVADTGEDAASSSAPAETEQAAVEIRIQGREYNYQNLSYGNSEHPLEELLEALKDFPPETRIDLIVEDDATKNAVDDLEAALTAAGFRNIRK